MEAASQPNRVLAFDLQPEVIFAMTTPSVNAVLRETRSDRVHAGH
jgi:hypothetical protein